MKNEFGVCGSALDWIQSYLSRRSQSAVIDGVTSNARPLGCDLPQGSLVGPFCFQRYSGHIGQIARKHNIMVHLYADNTQLYLAFYPDEGAAVVEHMTDCTIEIHDWMDVRSIKVGEAEVQGTNTACNIGVIMDSSLNIEAHVNQITSACYFNLCNISRICRNLTNEATITLVQSLFVSKLDSSNAILNGVLAVSAEQGC